MDTADNFLTQIIPEVYQKWLQTVIDGNQIMTRHVLFFESIVDIKLNMIVRVRVVSMKTTYSITLARSQSSSELTQRLNVPFVGSNQLLTTTGSYTQPLTARPSIDPCIQ